MKNVFKLFFFICAFISMSATVGKFKESDIAGVYKGISSESGTKAITEDGIKEVTRVLIPLRMEEGKYPVKITRIAKDTYKVDGKNIYIETRYCYEYSYSQEAVLQITSQYGYTRGKLIFQ